MIANHSAHYAAVAVMSVAAVVRKHRFVISSMCVFYEYISLNLNESLMQTIPRIMTQWKLRLSLRAVV